MLISDYKHLVSPVCVLQYNSTIVRTSTSYIFLSPVCVCLPCCHFVRHIDDEEKATTNYFVDYCTAVGLDARSRGCCELLL